MLELNGYWDSKTQWHQRACPTPLPRMAFCGRKAGGLVESSDSFLGDLRDFRKMYNILKNFPVDLLSRRCLVWLCDEFSKSFVFLSASYSSHFAFWDTPVAGKARRETRMTHFFFIWRSQQFLPPARQMPSSSGPDLFPSTVRRDWQFLTEDGGVDSP